MAESKSGRTRVLIVDDSPIVRRGLVFALMATDRIEIVGEAASGEEAIELVETLIPDVLLIDLYLPGMDGIATMKQLRARHSHLPVLILSCFLEPYDIRAALAAGAAGYMSKDVSLAELGRAILTARTGSTILSESATQALLQTPPSQALSASFLSKRQQQVLDLVAAGLSNDEIARELVISPATARF